MIAVNQRERVLQKSFRGRRYEAWRQLQAFAAEFRTMRYGDEVRRD